MEIQPVLYAVWTRKADQQNLAGRLRTISAIQGSMKKYFSTQERILRSVLEDKRPSRLCGVLWASFKEVLSGCLPSLQCLLFHDGENFEPILQEIEASKANVIYFDSVRTYFLARRVRRRFPDAHIVVDFDDLMSRRMGLGIVTKCSMSLGYLSSRAPKFMNRWLKGTVLSCTVAEYERRALLGTEKRFGELSDDIVLVSSIEGRILETALSGMSRRARVNVLPPPVDGVHPAYNYTRFRRFIFIGTDTLPQNRMTIEWILDVWKQYRPEAEVYLYGKLTLKWEVVTGVHFCGYANTLDEVYSDGSVLLSPSMLAGGIKTKIAEAFAHGCAVVGNSISFEGMDIPSYPLCKATDEIIQLILHPEVHRGLFRSAAQLGNDFVTTHLNRDYFEKRWMEILSDPPEQPRGLDGWH